MLSAGLDKHVDENIPKLIDLNRRFVDFISVYVSICVYIYIYIYMYSNVKEKINA